MPWAKSPGARSGRERVRPLADRGLCRRQWRLDRKESRDDALDIAVDGTARWSKAIAAIAAAV